MPSVYAPVAGTASRSPRRGSGSSTESIRTSPDSQCLPATPNVPVGSSPARFATSAVYLAPYSCGRGLSERPPSTATQVRSPDFLTEPTAYSVTPALPTSDRPGSRIRLASARRPLVRTSTNSAIDGALSPAWVGTPRPPPRSTTSGDQPLSARYAVSQS